MEKEKKETSTKAKANWAKLRDIVKAGKIIQKDKVRMFDLFDRSKSQTDKAIINDYSLNGLKLRMTSPLPDLKELINFKSEVDATGRWVWECEEIAAFFLYHKGEQMIESVLRDSQEEVRQVRVLEIGAGSSGLAGITLYKRLEERRKDWQVRLEITDGEQGNVPYLQQNIAQNKISQHESKGYKLLWGSQEQGHSDNYHKTDLLIVCDCLFFDKFHSQLLRCMDMALTNKGKALFVNPTRGTSTSDFKHMAESAGFTWQEEPLEDALYLTQLYLARSKPSFEEDKHLPRFIVVSRVQ